MGELQETKQLPPTIGGAGCGMGYADDINCPLPGAIDGHRFAAQCEDEPEARSGLSATAELQYRKVHEHPLRDSRLSTSGESGSEGAVPETKQLPTATGGAGCGMGCKDEPEARSAVYRKVHEHRSKGEDAADRPQAAPPAEDFIVSRNACKLCTPLGAALAFKGVAGAINLLHGSQGCATYIRRYLISHFREPIDIASSNFTEHTTVFGGRNNLHIALDNLMSQYQPALIGVATTCLAETIGEDLPGMLKGWTEARTAAGLSLPALVGVNTPSYIGTHREGFQATVREIVQELAGDICASDSADYGGSPPASVHGVGQNTTPNQAASTKDCPKTVNLLPGMCSPADLRWLKETAMAFGLDSILLPDYSESLDGGLWTDYQAIPAGGTSLADIGRMSQASASLELGVLPLKDGSAGSWLSHKSSRPLHALDLPIGIALTDRFLDSLAAISGEAMPPKFHSERQRLADSYVDAHKYLAGLPVAVFGEEDFVVAMACFLAETGLKPMLCASGGKTGLMASRLPQLLATYPGLQDISIAQGIDFVRLEDQARQLGVQMAIGSSKGFKLASHLGIPLVRCGFPIHDRYGGGRLLHFGYRGAQELFDRIVNARLEARQSADPIGYTYF